MKRSELKRTTQMARTSYRFKRAGKLRPVSKKRAKQNRTLNHCGEFRRQHRGARCQWCRQATGTEAHHIASKNHPYRHHRTGLLWLCGWCHAEVIPGVDRLVVFAVRALLPGWDEEIAYKLHQAKDGRSDWLPLSVSRIPPVQVVA